MFAKIAAFELRYQVRSPLFWVTALIFFLLTFGSITSDSVRIGGIGGNVNKNSPFAVGRDAADHGHLRGVHHGGVRVQRRRARRRDRASDRSSTRPASPSSTTCSAGSPERSPPGARRSSACRWACCSARSCHGSIPRRSGRFDLGDYLYAYFAVALPTLLVMAAFFFALATITRSMFGTYVGLVAMLMTYFVVAWRSCRAPNSSASWR